MRSFIFLLILIAVVVVAVSEPLSPPSSAQAQKPSPPAIPTAEQMFKNIQVFKGVPAPELDQAMAFITGSLGVKCSYCHVVNQFEKDEKPTKAAARRMIKMVFEINKGTFAGAGAVSCFTCHRGQPLPLSVPALGRNLWQPNTTPAVVEAPLPTVDQVLEKYVQALGGAPAIERFTSRVAKGSRIGADGVLVPEEVYQKAPNKLLTITSYPNVVFRTAFNGTEGWGNSSKEGSRELPDELLTQLKRDSVFYKEIKTRELYSSLTMGGKTTVGDREAYVIEARPISGSPEKLYFDTQTGLLIRRYLESPIVLGKFPLQTDYEDYREVDGIKQPFLIHWSIPGRVWGRRITEIKQNVPVDDAQFNRPATKP